MPSTSRWYARCIVKSTVQKALERRPSARRFPRRPPVAVRPAARGDGGAIASLLDQLGRPAADEQVESRLERLLDDPRDHVLVAELSIGEHQTVIAGLLAMDVYRLLHEDAPHAQITALVTDRQFRHRGVARALTEEARLIARQHGCAVLHARSDVGRDDAHGFFRAIGFEESHLSFELKP